MTIGRGVWLAWLPGFLAVGVSYWQIPYQRLNLPDALLGPGLFVVVVTALVLCLRNIAPFWWLVGMAGSSVPLAVFARVIRDAVRDPTSHNLWPFEIIIAAAVGLACALAGGFIGRMIGVLIGWRERS